MYSLPTEIHLESQVLHIRNAGDFRVIIDCFGALQDEELDSNYRIFTAAYIFYEDFDSIQDVMRYPYLDEAVKQMFWFFNCGEPENKESQTQNYKLIDWEADSQLVSSAINSVIRDEIRIKEYVHWWTFMGYYNAVGTSVLSTVVSIRKKIQTGTKLEKHEREFKRDNPQYFTIDLRSTEQKEMDNFVHELWNK